ncbi:FKBP-type peptidyl-prolyl cis-trans isomerase, partial [Emiliania huxleyi CCMP1516]|uniref:peptidylprolyl isomerase n=3 Tax=Emiliania huxleyi TaxID=2903 RepID=A0A0D3KCT4_EMIH1
GLTKRVVRAGTGECPSEGQSVEVHYTGSLADGSVFDSSRSRGKPIDFTLGMGEVIPGWDLGVSSMQVGEAAVLTIPPEFGYGSSGAGPIPPNATLTFEVELVS